jgi:rRNA maturation RNase YbeY
MYEPGELSPDFTGMLGDIVISIDSAERQTEDNYHQERLNYKGPWSLLMEVQFLLVHSLLHLVGHNHDSKVNADRMIAEESRLFSIIKD